MSTFSPTELNALIDTLEAQRTRHLAGRPVRQILATIDQVTQRWLDPDSEERRDAGARLPQTTGLSPAMIRHVLPVLFGEFRNERLGALLTAELGRPDSLDGLVSMGREQRTAVGPQLSVHVMAGNLPGAGLDGVIFSLLVKSATLVKAASGEPVLPSLFARSLSAVDPELGSCLRVVTWPGGRADLESVAFGRAELVVAAGSDASLAAIQQCIHATPATTGGPAGSAHSTKFIGYGHKLSFGLITKAGLGDPTALAPLSRAAAYDIAVYDQLGCLSPQLIYVEEGGTITPKEFAACLADGLDDWQTRLPRGSLPGGAATTIRNLRDQAEWQALAGKDVVLHVSSCGTDWTVVYDADPTFVPSPLYRTVRVKPLREVAQLGELVAAWRPLLEAVGVAAAPSERARVGELLTDLGVNRVCPLGTMQHPPLSWRHGGRPRVGDFVRWTGVESPT